MDIVEDVQITAEVTSSVPVDGMTAEPQLSLISDGGGDIRIDSSDGTNQIEDAIMELNSPTTSNHIRSVEGVHVSTNIRTEVRVFQHLSAFPKLTVALIRLV